MKISWKCTLPQAIQEIDYKYSRVSFIFETDLDQI